MNKREFIEMILAFYGYKPTEINNYREGGTQGTLVSVWEIEADNNEIEDSLSIRESSFKEAIYHLLKEIEQNTKTKVEWFI